MQSWTCLKAIAWICVTVALAQACFRIWSFVWMSFFSSTIAIPASVLAVYLTLVTLLIGGASFSKFVWPVLGGRLPAINEEEC